MVAVGVEDRTGDGALAERVLVRLSGSSVSARSVDNGVPMTEMTHVDPVRRHTAVVRSRLRPEELPTFLAGAFDAVGRAVAKEGIHVTGPPLTVYRPLRGATSTWGPASGGNRGRRGRRGGSGRLPRGRRGIPRRFHRFRTGSQT
jgi:hypothetical protein